MPRRPRITLPGFPHHLTQRGNRKMDVFLETADRRHFLSLLQKYSQPNGVDIWSYCLMTNHFHLVALPTSEIGLSKCMHDTDGAYAQYFNRKYDLTGHLWQDRFFGCPLDSSHLWNALRYVECNPVRAGLVDRAEQYRWSSAAAHCGLRSDPILTDSSDFLPEGLIPDWSAWLQTGLAEEELHRIRQATRKGIPYGSPAFVVQLETLLGIPLLPRRPGRKKRTHEDGSD